MMSSVHFQFKSAKEFSTVSFEGSYISLSELKKAIIAQKKLAKADFDLQITNAQTGEGAAQHTVSIPLSHLLSSEYKDDATLIPKNTSVIVARVPLSISRPALVATKQYVSVTFHRKINRFAQCSSCNHSCF
jgi:E3 ubiquitin-protein ligase RBBP6